MEYKMCFTGKSGKKTHKIVLLLMLSNVLKRA